MVNEIMLVKNQSQFVKNLFFPTYQRKICFCPGRSHEAEQLSPVRWRRSDTIRLGLTKASLSSTSSAGD